MSLADLKLNGCILGKSTGVNVIIPDTIAEKPYKNLYLLHGLGDDYTVWQRRTSIERFAAKYGIAVIMPDGAKSFYTDMKYGEAYYTYIAKELPQIMKRIFGFSDKREDNFIAGNSMGGYGALKIALRNPDSFCAAAGLSPATDMRVRRFEDIMKAIFGEELTPSDEDDLFKLVSSFPEGKKKPELYIGIGTNDFLYEENSRFKTAALENGFDLTYEESFGDHNWDFWNEYIVRAIEWMTGKR